jgi:hypothetical protein
MENEMAKRISPATFSNESSFPTNVVQLRPVAAKLGKAATQLSLVDKIKMIAAKCRDETMSDAEFRMYCGMLAGIHHTKTNQCKPSFTEAGAAACRDDRTAKRLLPSLEAGGHIKIERSNGGRNKRNSYSFPIPNGVTADTVSDLNGVTTDTVSNAKRCHSVSVNGVTADTRISTSVKTNEKKRERTQASSRTRISSDAKLTPRQVEIAESMGFTTMDQRRPIFLKFRDYHVAKGSLMADWNAAWRLWLRREEEFGKPDNDHTDIFGRQIPFNN